MSRINCKTTFHYTLLTFVFYTLFGIVSDYNGTSHMMTGYIVVL